MKQYTRWVSLNQENAKRWLLFRSQETPIERFVRNFNYETCGPVQIAQPLPQDAERILHDAGILPIGATLECVKVGDQYVAVVFRIMDENELMVFEEKALIAKIEFAFKHLLESKKKLSDLLNRHPSHFLLVRWIANGTFTKLDDTIKDLQLCLDGLKSDSESNI